MMQLGGFFLGIHFVSKIHDKAKGVAVESGEAEKGLD
jgi:hypothetical protein